MTSYREYYPNLSVVTRVYPSHSDSDGTAVVRQVWKTDGKQIEHNGHIRSRTSCVRGGKRSSRSHSSRSSWKGSEDEKLRKQTDGSEPACFQITIPHGRKYDKKWLITTLREHSRVPFHPLHYCLVGNNVHFYVEDSDTAGALQRLSRRITDSEGYQVLVFIKVFSKSPFNQSNLMPEDLKHLKGCIYKRFDVSQKNLDLRNICNDPDLVSQNILVKINQKNCMRAVLDIIKENIPGLLCLNLSYNKLFHLNDLEDLVHKTPCLKTLNLSHNELRYEKDLDKLKGLGLVELWLDRNPLCDSFHNQNSYIRAVRERFPKLCKLDGHTLPPPISFGLETSTVLPLCKGSYLVSDEVNRVIQHFLQQYYSVYDSGDRQQLINVYHNRACFSLSLPPVTSSFRYMLKEYQEDNRNLKQITNSSKWIRLLKCSRLNVVAFLNKLPKTKHISSSFTVDVNTFTSTLLAFTVSGLFKQVLSGSKEHILGFSRVFITAPAPNSGLCVVNDKLHLRLATPEEVQQGLNTPPPDPPTPSTSTVSTLSASQQEMLFAFSRCSRMNLEWSQKCLQDNAWDFNQAGQIFTELKEQGKIPDAAFICSFFN